LIQLRLEGEFPTAALARFVVGTDWTDLVFNAARLTPCVRPKDLG